MSLTNAQYDAIMQTYDEKQLRHRHILDEHIKEAYETIPQLSEIDAKVAEISISKLRARFHDQTDETDLHAAISALSDKRRKLLETFGFPGDYLDMQYDCPNCRDTGYIDNRKCHCFLASEIELLYEQSNIRDRLKEENFSVFSLDYYSRDIRNESTGLSSYETASIALQKCISFTENFKTSFENLFFYGDTGLGKTFLSHCIAKELIDHAFSVIYFTAFDLFTFLAKHRFSPDGDAKNVQDNLFDCDLLIIDDLGTELTNSFVSSQLFLCINERLLRKKSTIISTNLPLEQFAETYSERTFSRISSSYTMIKLFGNDIRIQKKIAGGTHT